MAELFHDVFAEELSFKQALNQTGRSLGRAPTDTFLCGLVARWGALLLTRSCAGWSRVGARSY